MLRRTNLSHRYSWLYDVLFLLVLVLAGYLRLSGVNWGEGQHQHPDENFFTSVLKVCTPKHVTTPLVPVQACPPNLKHWISIGDYFNSSTSPLNPYNRGFSFYVYGNLPMTIVRIAADVTNPTNLQSIWPAVFCAARICSRSCSCIFLSHNCTVAV